VYGKIYADWYYDVSNNSAIIEKSQVELSRVYLGYNYKIDDNFTTDALLDVARINPATGVAATFTAPSTVGLKLSTAGNYIAYLKTAYLAWKNILPTTTLTVGQIPYFAFDVQESFWGHRYLYKTLMDNEGWESSADLGASVRIAPIEMLKIVAGVTNGEGYKAAQDAYGDYRVAGGVQVNPLKELTIYVYGDWMPIDKMSTDSSQTTVAGFVGYKYEDLFKVGVEYDAQMKQKGVTDHNVGGLSIDAMYSIIKPLEVFARYDMMSSKNDWNTSQDGQAVIAGLQYSPMSKVKFALDYQTFTAKPSGSIASDKIYINGEFDY
jgi:opacity protein-like surface antigen